MITSTELQKLKKLAKLSFSDHELESFAEKLNNVITMIDSLKDINCDNVEPLRSVCDIHQRMREDKVNHNNIAEQLFANVPLNNAELAKEVKCFIVPKMME